MSDYSSCAGQFSSSSSCLECSWELPVHHNHHPPICVLKVGVWCSGRFACKLKWNLGQRKVKAQRVIGEACANLHPRLLKQEQPTSPASCVWTHSLLWMLFIRVGGTAIRILLLQYWLHYRQISVVPKFWAVVSTLCPMGIYATPLHDGRIELSGLDIGWRPHWSGFSWESAVKFLCSGIQITMMTTENWFVLFSDVDLECYLKYKMCHSVFDLKTPPSCDGISLWGLLQFSIFYYGKSHEGFQEWVQVAFQYKQKGKKS